MTKFQKTNPLPPTPPPNDGSIGQLILSTFISTLTMSITGGLVDLAFSKIFYKEDEKKEEEKHE